MSTAAATSADAPAPKGGGKKKLLMLLLVALLVLGIAGGGLVVYLKKKAAAAAEAEGDDTPQVEAHNAHPRDAKHAPTFVPLEMFTVNLSDREAERYAQIGVTLEIEDAKVADDIKAYMPAIRSAVLLLLSHKTSQQLLDAEGKQRLAFEIKREASHALGIDIPDEPEKGASAAEGGSKPKRKRATEPSPIRQVHFSNFIIQ